LFRNERDVLDLPQGQVIFRAGDPGDAMYAVLEGVVNIVANGTLIEQIGENGIFGEMALVDGAPRSADAVASTAVKLARIDQERFVFVTKYNPFVSLEVLRITVERLRRQLRAPAKP